MRAPVLASVAVALAVALAVSPGTPAHAATKVPAGNRSAEQPAIPAKSARRTKRLKTTYERKYAKIRNLIAGDRKLRGKIRKAAAAFGIDPIHIVGALVGEHTYNVDAMDRMQTYYVKAMAYMRQDMAFAYKGERVTRFVRRPEFSPCRGLRGSYPVWSCRERVWDTRFRGKRVAGRAWPNATFGRTFFQPLYAGQTFGLGQLNPLTALKVNDMVASKGWRMKRLSARRAPEVYAAIMDPDVTLMTMAAVIRNAIDTYETVAGMDISGNPGITATLYNLGRVQGRAEKLAATNKERRLKGRPAALPRENYYGWLVNERLADLRAALR